MRVEVHAVMTQTTYCNVNWKNPNADDSTNSQGDSEYIRTNVYDMTTNLLYPLKS